MSMLDALFGGGRQRADLEDFVRRFDQGAPWDGIGDDEAIDRYREVAGRVPTDVYEESAQDAFARLTPEQRSEFARWLRDQASSRGASVPDLSGGDDAVLRDPRNLARATTRLRDEQPGLLEQLLGGALGGAGGATGAPSGVGDLLGGVLGGATGSGTSPGAGGSGLLSSPIAKAALAGIAAMAMQRMMSRR